MKFYKLLFILIGLLPVLSSCEKNNDDTPNYGKIEYDGKAFEVNSASCIDITLPYFNGLLFKYIYVANTTKGISGETNCSFYVPVTSFYTDFDVEITADTSSYITFRCGNKNYTSVYFDSINTIGIDPATGLEYQNGEPEYTKITSGRIQWTVGKSGGHLEFNLTFEDGKTTKGYGDIPFDLFQHQISE